MRNQKQPTPNEHWLRIEAIINHFKLQSVSALARNLELPRSENLYQIRRGNNGISRDLANTICRAFPEISKGWLLTGEGPMFYGVEEKNAILETLMKIPFYVTVPINPENTEPDKFYYWPKEIGGNAELATVYRGNALLPMYTSGAILLLKKWEPDSELIYGDAYLIRTANFSAFRIIRQMEAKNALRLTSCIPEKYDDMLIARDEIQALYHVCAASIL